MREWQSQSHVSWYYKYQCDQARLVWKEWEMR